MPKRKPENKTIQVILLENDKHLGEKFEVVRVAPVFARNVLLPEWKAVLANKLNLHNFMAKMEAAETTRKQRASDIGDMVKKIQMDDWIKLTWKVNEKNTLYAKIDENNIADAIKETYKIDVETHWFKMKKKFVEPGDYLVAFEYREVVANIAVKVVGEMDEATKKKMQEMQASAEPTEEEGWENSTESEENTEEKSE